MQDKINKEIIETNFDECFKNSENIPLINWENIIKKCFGNNTIIEWKKDVISQFDFGSDLLITSNKGRKYSMDIKTRRKEYFGYDKWIFEIIHHRYINKTKKELITTIAGWLYKSTSDLILFATINDNEIIESIIFSLIPFKNENFEELKYLENGWASTIFNNGTYQITMNKKIPLDFIQKYSNYYWYWKKPCYH